jgi:single-strand selective monofunctional uracil DNA glycosylase
MLEALASLRFSSPVSHVYNPLSYAREPYENYLKAYARAPKETVLIGMNPGPWGMAQTGIPLGEIAAVTEWLGIEGYVAAPADTHPRRPIWGYGCKRSEVSGKRLWGWARETFQTPQRFFKRFFVANYCPLMFVDKDGRNRTPDHLPAADRNPLLNVCDRFLSELVDALSPRYVVGVGRFAEVRARAVLHDREHIIGRITHPSPANPKANKGWTRRIEKELRDLGIRL